MSVMAGGKTGPAYPASNRTNIVWHEKPGADVLASLWSSLSDGVVCSSFQTKEFVDCFFRELAPATCETFGVLAAYWQDNPAPCALLPLIRYRKGPVRIASSPDLGVADQNAPVLSRAFANEDSAVVQAVAFDMIGAISGADVLDIRKLHASMGDTSNPLFWHPGATGESSTLFLDADALAASGTGAQKGVYKKSRASFRKIEKEGVRLVEAASAGERLEILETLMVHREQRFNSLGRRNTLKQDNRENFYRALAAQPGRDNPLKVLALKTDTSIVAAVAMLVNEGHLNGILISIGAEQWHRYSPGMVMLVQSLYWARDNNMKIYNFGAGLQAYKSRFGATEQPTRRLLLPLNAKGWAAITAVKARQHAKEMLKAFKAD